MCRCWRSCNDSAAMIKVLSVYQLSLGFCIFPQICIPSSCFICCRCCCCCCLFLAAFPSFLPPLPPLPPFPPLPPLHHLILINPSLKWFRSSVVSLVRRHFSDQINDERDWHLRRCRRGCWRKSRRRCWRQCWSFSMRRRPDYLWRWQLRRQESSVRLAHRLRRREWWKKLRISTWVICHSLLCNSLSCPFKSFLQRHC